MFAKGIHRSAYFLLIWGWTFFFVALLGGMDRPAYASEKEPVLKLVESKRIWDQGAHNAFTDLVRFQNQFYCVFREASAHVSPDGKIRILSSGDGEKWEPVDLLMLEGFDLRDPKIVCTPDASRLMVLGGAAVRKGHESASEERTFVTFSENGKGWTPIQWVCKANQWLWRITWFHETAYGVAYNVGPSGRSKGKYGTILVQSPDGKKYTELVPNLYREGGATEATLRFDADGTCYCLQRRDRRGSNTALLGKSEPPYTKWEWKDLGRYFGGPNFIQIRPNLWLASGRFKTDAGAKTVVCRLDVKEGKLIPLLTLPSGGDTSYPGMAWYDNQLWISYYSSHEGKTSIYLARISVQ